MPLARRSSGLMRRLSQAGALPEQRNELELAAAGEIGCAGLREYWVKGCSRLDAKDLKSHTSRIPCMAHASGALRRYALPNTDTPGAYGGLKSAVEV